MQKVNKKLILRGDKMNTEYQVIDLLCTLKSNLCYLDEKTYKDICAVLDCAIILLEN